MSELTHASLFSGIGGIDLAAEAAGFETCAQVEINPFAAPSSLSVSRTPNNSEILEMSRGGDITRACGGNPTVLSGGFPCQPVSLAGNRQGSKDARWLWPEYLRLIRECRPSWIVAENVAALISLPEFAGIHTDLKKAGYQIGIYILSAANIGAPHQRKRCFIVAHSCRVGLQTANLKPCGTECPNTSFSPLCSSYQRGIHQTLNTDSFAGLQANSSENPKRESRETRNSITWLSLGGFPLPDWSGYPSAVCRVDDGLPHKLDKSRLQALGNAVVPRCAFPFFEAIAKIEGGELND